MAGPFRTSDLKSRILNLAQTSVFQVKMQPPQAVMDHIRKPILISITMKMVKI